MTDEEPEWGQQYDESRMSTLPREQLTEILVKAADTLVEDYDLVDFLGSVTGYATRVSGTAAVGLLLADPRGRLQFLAGSEESARQVEFFSVSNDQGPCRDCFVQNDTVLSRDLRTEHRRWPVFAPRAVTAGFRSACALPIRHHGQPIGALGLFGAPGDVLNSQSLKAVQALAAIATIGIPQEQANREEMLTEQLQAALNTRVAVEQAKGVLSQRRQVDIDHAFRLLCRYSHSHELRISQVARDIAADPYTHPGLTQPPLDVGYDVQS